MNLRSSVSSLSFFSSSVKYCSMWLFRRFMRSSSFVWVKLLVLEFTALNLEPSIDWFSFPKRSSLSQMRFHCMNVCFRGLMLSFLKFARVRKSGCWFLLSYMVSRLRVVSLASLRLDRILLW